MCNYDVFCVLIFSRISTECLSDRDDGFPEKCAVLPMEVFPGDTSVVRISPTEL